MEKRNECRLLVGRPEENRQPRRPKHKLVNNIEIDLEREDGVV
jgi:hypothetical protein